MTPKQYAFLKNLRIIVIVLGAAYLVFGAGAIFTGYKPTPGNYAILGVVILNLLNAIINKPVLPASKPDDESDSNKINT